jgi:hypothetical protein
MKRKFGKLTSLRPAGPNYPAGATIFTVVDAQGHLMVMPPTVEQLVWYDTDYDDGLTHTITLTGGDYTNEAGGVYWHGSTFTGTRGQCVGIGMAQNDLSTLV